VQRRSVIAIMSDLGVQIWSMDGEHMLFYYALSSLLGTQFEEGRFMRGATGLNNFLCVGCSTGSILVFDCSGDLQRGNFPLLHSLESRGQAISVLSSSSSYLTAGDDMGNIFCYKIDDAFELGFSISGNGVPCTALFNTTYAIFAGFSSGHIRVYRPDTRELAIEIAAHVRMVTGLTYNEETQLAASCSSDQYLHVWSVPDFRSKANSNLDCVYSSVLENKMCTGVAFINEHKLAVAAYDEEEISMFHRI
jgi:WD40 repeat protein